MASRRAQRYELPMEDRRTARIAARVERDLGSPGLAAKLAELPWSEVQPLLLELWRVRAERTTVRELAAVSSGPCFVASSSDARLLHQFDAMALAAASEFAAVELSPVEPAGANAILGGIHPNNVLGALRRAEVLGDPTVALAFHAALKRRDVQSRRTPLRLCATQRCIRLQPFDGPPPPGLSAHFRLFALVTAGRDSGENRFETEALLEHLTCYLRLLRAARDAGFRFRGFAAEISDTEAVAAVCDASGIDVAEVRRIARAHKVGEAAAALRAKGASLPPPAEDHERVLASAGARVAEGVRLRLSRAASAIAGAFSSSFPEVPVRFDLARLEGLGFYEGLCFRIQVDGPPGPIPVIDGGFTSWTRRILNDEKERLLTSGVGSEHLCRLYAP